MSSPEQVLDEAAGGLWWVRTRTAWYWLDLDAGTACRTPLPDAADGIHEVRSLRRDEDTVKLYGLPMPVETGQPMHLMLQVRDDASPTLRSTTEVMQIGHAINGDEHLEWREPGEGYTQPLVVPVRTALVVLAIVAVLGGAALLLGAVMGAIHEELERPGE